MLHKEAQSKSKPAGKFIFAKRVCLDLNKHTLGQDVHLVFILTQAVTVSQPPGGSSSVQSDMTG